MPQGLQVFDAQGKLVVDYTTRLGSIIAVFNTNGAMSGTVPIPDIGNRDVFGFCLPSGPYQNLSYVDLDRTGGVIVSKVSSTLIGWRYNVEYWQSSKPLSEYARHTVYIGAY